MNTLALGLSLLLSTLTADTEAGRAASFKVVELDLLTRVEQTERLVNGQPVPRVERDEAGNVVRLFLNDMRLTPEEFQALGRLTALKYVNFFRTNVTSADLAHLRDLKDLSFIVLISTEVTDEAVPHLCQLPALKTMCLMDVLMTRAGVDELKQRIPNLSLGYSQRK